MSRNSQQCNCDAGETTAYTYDGANQLVSSEEDGILTTRYRYDAGGQLAAATHGDKTESFLWDGLALIRRDGTDYVNEPHAGGGAPVLAGDKVLFNDLLGSTLGSKDANGFNAVQRTAFGETGGKSTDEFFTGKPMVDAFNTIWNSNLAGNGERANQATYDYFSSHPYWTQISDQDGLKRWRKFE